jgi:hypothetical protein
VSAAGLLHTKKNHKKIQSGQLFTRWRVKLISWWMAAGGLDFCPGVVIASEFFTLPEARLLPPFLVKSTVGSRPP